MEITKENVDRLVNVSVENEKLKNDITSAKADKLIAQKEVLDLKSKIIELEKENKKEKVSRVEIGNSVIRTNSWGDRCVDFTPLIVTSDLMIVKDEIEKAVKSNYEDQLNSLSKNLKSTKKEVKELLEDRDDFRRSTSRNFDKKLKSYIESYDVEKEKLDSKIKSLKEELVKERDNKTDAELEAKREEKMNTLKKRIIDLEHEVSELVGLGFFKRIWYKLTNIPALAKAKQSYVETEAIINNTTLRNSFFYWFK